MGEQSQGYLRSWRQEDSDVQLEELRDYTQGRVAGAQEGCASARHVHLATNGG